MWGSNLPEIWNYIKKELCFFWHFKLQLRSDCFLFLFVREKFQKWHFFGSSKKSVSFKSFHFTLSSIFFYFEQALPQKSNVSDSCILMQRRGFRWNYFEIKSWNSGFFQQFWSFLNTMYCKKIWKNLSLPRRGTKNIRNDFTIFGT